MTRVWARALEAVQGQGAAATIRVTAVRGSAPREAGATIVLRPDGRFWGTIGGGALEWEAIAGARAQLEAGRGRALQRTWPLGPDLGQCCGGSVVTVVETFDHADLALLRDLSETEARAIAMHAWIGSDGRVVRLPAPESTELPSGAWLEPAAPAAFPVAIFGAGHVGRALALALAPLPVAVTWIDPREAAFPALLPSNVSASRLDDPTEALAQARTGTAVLVMTHSHPLDLAIVAQALRREDLGPVGLIGSASKRARFLGRLREAGLGDAAARRLVCPIGIEGIGGKEPAVIAASVAAQVLLWREEALRMAGTPARRAQASGSGTDAGRVVGRRANPAGEVRVGRGQRAGG